jgi:hypothetical protein
MSFATIYYLFFRGFKKNQKVQRAWLKITQARVKIKHSSGYGDL